MFTGIIRETQRIKNVKKESQSLFVSFELPHKWKSKTGDSISINGICSTLRVLRGGEAEVEYMPETISKTTASGWKKGEKINLEQSLKVGDRLEGHFVTGHVDAVGEVVEIEKKGRSKILKIKIPKEFVTFVAPKGSITVDGVSLTVVSQSDDWFTVSLVDFTLKNTNLKNSSLGGRVNIETDIFAKYLLKRNAEK